MDITAETPMVERQIGAKEGPVFKVRVPAPFAVGIITLTAGLAHILNQTIAENVGNNLRAKLIEGVAETKDEAGNVLIPARAYTDEEAQAMVDAYIAEYEPGVARRGDGSPRIVDPVEREMRSIATTMARELVSNRGMKWKDIDSAKVIDALLEKHGPAIRKNAQKIVDQRNIKTGDDFDLDALLAAPADADSEQSGDAAADTAPTE